jgi:hypothetical protein
VPASLELQREYGSDLQVLFVECQGADLATAEAFAWRQKWMGTAAMWTTERPLDPEGNGLPAFALLDTEGNVLLKGNPLDMKKKIEEAIALQVEKAKSPPAGTPAKLAKAWGTFVKGNVAAALAECDKLGAADAGLAETAQALRAQMVARTEARIARATWLGENGYPGEGREQLLALGKAVDGCAELVDAVARPLAKLALTPALQAEIDATKALASLQQKMAKDKPFDDGNLKSLEKLAEKHAGTKAADRATHLLQLAKLKVR